MVPQTIRVREAEIQCDSTLLVGVSVAYNFQIGNNKIKLLTQYENVTQKVDSVDNKTF
jgi:hypothetical protein